MKSFTFAVLAATAAAKWGDEESRAYDLLTEFLGIDCYYDFASNDESLDGEAASRFASASNAVSAATNGEFGDSNASPDDMMMPTNLACDQAVYYLHELER